MSNGETFSSLKRLFSKDNINVSPAKAKNREEDAGWVRRLKNGDRTAFDRLVEKYQKDIYLICYSILWHREEAEEATMVAFERSFRKIWSLNDEKKYFAFLKQICANYCKDIIRKRIRERKYVDGTKTLGKEISVLTQDPLTVSIPKRPDEALEEKEEEAQYEATQNSRKSAIRKALSELREIEREIVVLKIYKELTFEEVAVKLDISANTAKTGFYRALNKLSNFQYLRELV